MNTCIMNNLSFIHTPLAGALMDTNLTDTCMLHQRINGNLFLIENYKTSTLSMKETHVKKSYML